MSARRTTTTIRGWVAGRVQGVAYRASFARQAETLGVTGWVRNLADGRVAFLVHGDATSVTALLDWAKRGPRLARVDELHQEAGDEPVPASFEIRY